MTSITLLFLFLGLVPLAVAAQAQQAQKAGPPQPVTGPDVIRQTVQRVLLSHGQIYVVRVGTGVQQVAERWRAEDGDAQAFSDFCDQNFLVTPEDLEKAFQRLERVFEQVDGHIHEVRRELTTPIDLDTGPLTPLDRMFADVDLAAHVDEDLYRSKVAFFALLNFPLNTLEERLQFPLPPPGKPKAWQREAWARSRVVDRFVLRVPPEVQQEVTRAFNAAEQYSSAYNIRLDRLVTPRGERLFPEGLRLISHWGLRDELASHYAAPAAAAAAGLARQRMVQKVLERIVRQEIPAAVIDNPDLSWDPESNRVRPVREEEAVDPDRLAAREPDTRYQRLLEVFHAVRKVDPYSPQEPTYIERRFERGREIPEKEVEALLASVLDSQEARDVARLVQRRLGRPLEPFDIWYSGFKPRGRYGEEELDRVVKAKYPTAEAVQAGLPEILRKLGFTAEKAAWLAERIVIDPARGAGHALGAIRREDKAHLRTRVPQGGMDYKGWNIAIHELGHNVEQVFSLNGIDFWSLAGVPNTAFTEAIAFLFQKRDLELLGLQSPGEEAGHLEALATLWTTYEIAGVALVDMRVWRWLYEHPEATPAELREATLAIAREVWNRHYAPAFGVRDSDILAVYSHMIVYGLYLPDYPLGLIIAFQLASKIGQGDFGAEVERVTRLGRLTPDAWMRLAVGEPISARALLEAARQALGVVAQAGR